MAHSSAVAALAPNGDTPSQGYSAVEIARKGSATIVRLVVPELVSKTGRIFSDLTDLAIAGRGRLVICMCKASECTQEWLAALSTLAHRCEVLGGRLIVCGTADPLEQVQGQSAKRRSARGRRPRPPEDSTRAGGVSTM